MIPPCDPSILEHNPKFKRLYENLTLNILNPDGSTRVHSADPARTVIAEVSRVTRTAVVYHTKQTNISWIYVWLYDEQSTNSNEYPRVVSIGPETMSNPEQ